MRAMTAHDMRSAIWRHFAGRWAVVFEVTARPEPLDEKTLSAYRRGQIGHAELKEMLPSQRRIDALLVRRAPRRRPTAAQQVAERQEWMARHRGVPLAEQPDGLFPTPPPAPVSECADDGGLERLALEIKVDRGDFLQDVRNPDKQAPWRELAERHAYAAPAGLIAVTELPAGSGLLEVDERGVRWKRNAPRTQTARPLPTVNVLDAFYRWSSAEAQIRGLTYRAERDGDIEQIRAELVRLRHELELQTNAVVRARGAAEVWQKRYATVGGAVCDVCGQPLRPARKGRTNPDLYLRWEHAPVDEQTCYERRRAAAVEEEMAKPEYRQLGQYLHVPGPEPRYPWDDDAAKQETDDACVVPG